MSRRLLLPLLPSSLRWAVAGCVAVFILYFSLIAVPPEVVLESGDPTADGAEGSPGIAVSTEPGTHDGTDIFELLEEQTVDILGFAASHWRHFVAYGALSFTLAYATASWKMPRWRNAIFVIGIAALYGVCIEIGQSFVPHRSDFMITDAVANTLGASLVIMWYIILPYITLRPIREISDQLTSWYETR